MTVKLIPKVTIKPNGESNESQILQETTQHQNIIERSKERELQLSQTSREEKQANERASIALKASKLSKELGGDMDDRMSQERTIHLKMTLDSRPEVIFTGFWNGKFIQAAQNAIARAYRQRRIVVLKQ